ncbi:hypothetical protein CVFO_0592 [Isorropodon fossajaponicum endosymbiont JTNG4]|uniref:hypothetical protein n=1 Tax=Isorropodon fossajaponicum symbiont TaxID=883811 RepID=UPI0019358C9A|nr:hypothetical protein [Isorropodon fossajaponicum symbiont]BBB23844.1 hypothetical protein CVFO_0592 [Isorropodon fossajaponicum endosymbiont JTNG4]
MNFSPSLLEYFCQRVYIGISLNTHYFYTMFKSGHSKVGGRKRGSKNKKTLLGADELLLRLDINPIEKLINIAESDEASIEQKIRCWQEISKYTYPKLKSQEIFIEPESDMPTRIEIVAYGEDALN